MVSKLSYYIADREAYNSISIIWVASVSFISTNSFPKKVSDFGHFSHLYGENSYIDKTREHTQLHTR